MGTVKRAAQINLTDVIFLDARSGPSARAAFREGHFPGARFAGLEKDLSQVPNDAKDGGRHPLPAVSSWAATLGRWGIRPDSNVVVYDDQGGANAAARTWWMLKAVGHENVSVLDGGFEAGKTAGWPLTSAVTGEVDPVEGSKTPPYPASEWISPLAKIAEVREARVDPQRVLIDARASERFSGESEPIDPIAGHIPGAVNVPLSGHLTNEGFFRDPVELRAMYENVLKGREGSQIIAQCGSGVTACHTLLALAHAGISGGALYVGSWSEWCRRDEPREPQ